MKYVFIILLVAIVFSSCDKEELVYSCDPEIDAIVKSATIEFSQISLKEFLEYDIIFQRAIYRSFTPEKMKAFWIEKLEFVKAHNFSNEAEQLHIQKLIDQFNVEYFDLAKIDSSEQKKRLDFIDKWSKDAVSNFDWSEKEIRYIIYTLYLSEEQLDAKLVEQQEYTLQSRSSSCNCAGEADCDYAGYDCGSGSCSTKKGCGAIWMLTCTGMCQ